MAPRRVASEEPSRRSRRQRSQEPEILAEHEVRQPKEKVLGTFLAVAECEALVYGKPVDMKLTKAALAAVIGEFVAREAVLRDQVTDLEGQVASLEQERSAGLDPVDADLSRDGPGPASDTSPAAAPLSPVALSPAAPSLASLPVASSSPAAAAAAAAAASPSGPKSPVASASSMPSWLRKVVSIGTYLSPLGKRRADTIEANDTPTKRVKTGEQQQATPELVRREELLGTTSTGPAKSVVSEGGKTPTKAEAATPARRRRLQTPRTYAGPSTKLGPKLPTSLSTISEYSEQSHIMANNDIPDPPPSKSAIRPRRSTVQLRAARLAALNTPKRVVNSWDVGAKQPRTAPPRERNADKRLEKMMQLRKLEDDLQDLKKDQDVVEMQSHRRKRVKIDDLIKIPHNRPGDAEGTFRFPDFDSDSEMEVDEDEPVRSNVFSPDATTSTPKALPPTISITPAAPAISTPATSSTTISAFPAASSTPKQTNARPIQAQLPPSQPIPAQQQPVDSPQRTQWSFATLKRQPPVVDMQWTFPDLGQKRPEQAISAEEEAYLVGDFRKGFLEWTHGNGCYEYCRERGLVP